MHKNTAVPMIAMLGHSELDIKVLDTGIKTVETNDYRGLLRDNRDTNGMLATT